MIYSIEDLKKHPNFNKYIQNFDKFIQNGGVITNIYPILDEFEENAGLYGGHYFHQDLLVASYIYENNPQRHVDIGSRIDGFVAHVATFRKIEIFDIRELPNTGHENIIFKKADLMNESLKEITDSISCLHAIEHFGLGRYGDPIDPEGYVKGFKNIIDMLKPKGKLYISFPIGKANEIHFNAHRVFHPKDIFNWYDISEILKLERFDYVDDLGILHKHKDLETNEIITNHGCGIYTFSKL
jgi:hypothetical protein